MLELSFFFILSLLFIAGVVLYLKLRASFLAQINTLKDEKEDLQAKYDDIKDEIEHSDFYNKSFLLSAIEQQIDENYLIIKLSNGIAYSSKSLLRELKVMRKGIASLEEFYSLIQVDYKVILEKKINHLLQTGKGFEEEAIFYPKYSSRFKYYLKVRIFELNEEKYLYLKLSDKDEIQSLYNQLDQQVRMLDEILGSTPDQFLRFDSFGKCIFANIKALVDLGYAKENLLGKHISELPFFENVHQKLLRQIQSVLATGQSVKGNIQLLTVDGLKQYEYDLVANYDVARNVNSVLATLRDITLQKEYERQLMDAQSRAIKSAKIKSEFLANMSHEIRTPLNSIIGIADLLLESELNKEQRRYVNIFQGACSTLLQLVNDILDFSKIEAGQMNLESIECNIETLVFDSVELISRNASEKGLPILVSIQPDVPKEFKGDPTRIKQVLFNLVSNAIKFTSEGFVSVDIEFKHDEERYIISVKDTGIGIKDEKMREIFSNFSQADSTITRLYGGTGLGLSICTKLVQLMGGRLNVESQENEGSTFYFDLKLPVLDISENKAQLINSAKKVVIVEKHFSHAQYIASFFENKTDIKIVESMSRLQELLMDSPDKISNLIISNHSIVNHIDDFKELITKETRIENCLFLTDQFSKTELSKFFKGLNVKTMSLPFNTQDFIDLFNNKLKDTDDVLIKKEAFKVRTEKTFNVLLVDDSEANLNLLNLFLKKENCVVHKATNGQIAVDLYMKEKFDIIFMDMQMPILDGYQATEKIREYEKANQLEKTPVIALTANVIQEHVNQCYLSGCDYYLSKPVKKDVFLKTIDSILNGVIPKREVA